MNFRKSAGVAIEQKCPCGWEYPVVSSQLGHQFTQGGAVKSEPGGYLNYCPACTRMYSVTPKGVTVHREPVQAATARLAPPPSYGPPPLRREQYARLPEDMLKAFDHNEPSEE